MNWETISATAGIFATITVVVSLIYLAKQVRDGNNNNVSAMTHQAVDLASDIPYKPFITI